MKFPPPYLESKREQSRQAHSAYESCMMQLGKDLSWRDLSTKQLSISIHPGCQNQSMCFTNHGRLQPVRVRACRPDDAVYLALDEGEQLNIRSVMHDRLARWYTEKQRQIIIILSRSRMVWLVCSLTARCCSTWSSNSKMVSFRSLIWFSASLFFSSKASVWVLWSCSCFSTLSRSCCLSASTCTHRHTHASRTLLLFLKHSAAIQGAHFLFNKALLLRL